MPDKFTTTNEADNEGARVSGGGENGPGLKLRAGTGREAHRVETDESNREEQDSTVISPSTKWWYGQVEGKPSEVPSDLK